MTTQELFAERLKEVRKEKGLTQDDMAAALGCSRMSYVYYENAKRTPDIDFLARLKGYTGYPADYLLGYTTNRQPETQGLDRLLGLQENAVNKIIGTPYFGKLINYIVSHPAFDEFACYAADSVARSFFLEWYALHGMDTSSTTHKESGLGLSDAEIAKIYRGLAAASLIKILAFDKTLCSEHGTPSGQYERRMASVMDSYFRRNDEGESSSGQQTSEP